MKEEQVVILGVPWKIDHADISFVGWCLVGQIAWTMCFKARSHSIASCYVGLLIPNLLGSVAGIHFIDNIVARDWSNSWLPHRFIFWMTGLVGFGLCSLPCSFVFVYKVALGLALSMQIAVSAHSLRFVDTTLGLGMGLGRLAFWRAWFGMVACAIVALGVLPFGQCHHHKRT